MWSFLLLAVACLPPPSVAAPIAPRPLARHPRHVYLRQATVDTRRHHTNALKAARPLGADLRHHHLLHFTALHANGRNVATMMQDVLGTTGTYIPEHTYEVYATHTDVLRLQAETSLLVWASILQSDHKMNEEVSAFLYQNITVHLPVHDRGVVWMLVTYSSVDMGDKDVIGLCDDLVVEATDRGAAAVHAMPWADDLLILEAYPSSLATAIRVATEHRQVSHVEFWRQVSHSNDINSVLVQGRFPGKHPLWDAGIMGQGEIIGVGDTGLEHRSCYFADTTEPPQAGQIGDHRKIVKLFALDTAVQPYSCYPAALKVNYNDATDESHGHGTHVAGTVAGVLCKNGAKPCEYDLTQAGMAPGAKMVFQDMAPPDPNRPNPRPANYHGAPAPLMPCSLTQFFDISKAEGTYIHSNSWGIQNSAASIAAGVARAYGNLAIQADNYMWDKPDFLALFAAGNDGRMGSHTVAEPATAKNVLAVGASEKDTLVYAAFSSFGPAPDGRAKPDVMAPGYQVISAMSLGPDTTDYSQCDTFSQSGSSMATPTTAGSAGLLRQALRMGAWAVDVKGKSAAELTAIESMYGIPVPEGALLRSLLIASADPFAEVDPFTGELQYPQPSGRTGFGRINLANVIPATAHGSGTKRAVWFNRHKPAPGAYSLSSKPMNFTLSMNDTVREHFFCFRVTASTDSAGDPIPLKVTLAWIERAAAKNSQYQVFNDLNLLVYDSTTTYKGNLGTSFDSVNNNEVVWIQKPPIGEYKAWVVLTGTGVAGGVTEQPYNLIITGAFEGPFQDSAQCPGAGTACPGSPPCNGAGTCTDGQCRCHPANSGVDCSVLNFDPNAAECAGCNNRGCKLNGDASCTCYHDSVNGYYGSSDCSTCDAYNGVDWGIDPTTNRCLLDKSCAGHGTYSDGQGCQCFRFASGEGQWGGLSCDQCEFGWFGPTCMCASQDCNGHGACTASGCVCVASWDQGYYTGLPNTKGQYSACDRCVDGRDGSTCKCLKPAGQPACSGRGTCGSSGCVCDATNKTGHWTFATVAEDCTKCADGWGPPGGCKAFLALCDTAHHGTVGLEGCTCHWGRNEGFWRSDNAEEWPCGSPSRSCGTNCARCGAGYVGPGDSLDTICRCPAADTSGALLCGGHGVCTVDGCQCYSDDVNGYWDTDPGLTHWTCTRCGPNWFGPGGARDRGCRCRGKANTAIPECDADSRGVCQEGGCKCHADFTNGFFQPTTIVNETTGEKILHKRDCGECLDQAGPPGVCKCRTETCDGYGVCEGNAGCKCYADEVRGFWMSANNAARWAAAAPDTVPTGLTYEDCSKCAAGFTSEGSGCTCNATFCAEVPLNGTGCAAGSTHHPCHQTIAADGTKVYLEFQSSVYTKEDVTLRMQYVKTDLKSHPSKQQPAGFRYFDKTTFFIEITPNVAPVAANNKHLVQQTSAPVAAGAAAVRYDLNGFIEVLVPYVEKPKFKAEDGSALDVSYGTDPPTLMYLDADAWKPAGETCPSTTRLTASNVLDTDRLLARGRLCYLQGQMQLALFVKVTQSTNLIFYIIGGSVLVALLCCIIGIIAVFFQRKLKRERRQREAKEKVVEFLTKQSEAARASLRAKLKLKHNEKFTETMAAKRFIMYRQKKRDQLDKFAKKYMERQATMVPKEQEKKRWEFKDHEIEFLEACRKVQSLFHQDPFHRDFQNRPNAAQEVQHALNEMKADHEKLRRLLQTVKRIDAAKKS